MDYEGAMRDTFMFGIAQGLNLTSFAMKYMNEDNEEEFIEYVCKHTTDSQSPVIKDALIAIAGSDELVLKATSSLSVSDF